MLDKTHDMRMHIAKGKIDALPVEKKENCSRCGEDEFSPNIEAFELSGEIVCENCAEEIFEDSSQFGVGA